MSRQSLFKKLALAFSVALMLIGSYSLAQDLGQLLDEHGEIYAKLLQIGKEVGKGALGAVYEVEIQRPGHEPEWVAMRAFRVKGKYNLDKYLESFGMLDLLAKIPNHDSQEGLSFPRQLRLSGVHRQDMVNSKVAIEALADGSVDQLAKKYFNISPDSPELKTRLAMLIRYKNEVLNGIHTLSEAGLVHGDVKPANVLVFTPDDFDWAHPDPTQMHFKLIDYDMLKNAGEKLGGFTIPYLAPEYLNGIKTKVSVAQDLYAHANSVYQVAFGKLPWLDYLEHHYVKKKWLKWAPYNKKTIFDENVKAWHPTSYGNLIPLGGMLNNEKAYQRYQEWLAKELEAKVQKMPDRESKLMMMQLRDFFLAGLDYWPLLRLEKFFPVGHCIPHALHDALSGPPENH